ncbi:MAG: hypothetical protein ACTHQQ_21250, partial [Solirubrobacteraceae bacterium]
MAAASNSTKGRVGLKAARAAIKHPAATRFVAKASAPAAKGGLRVGKVVAKRKAKGRMEDLVKSARAVGETARIVGETARIIGATIAIYGPEAAQLFGWVEQPKPKRTAPRVLLGVVLGATAMY